MSFYCAACSKEIESGAERFAQADGTPDEGGQPYHVQCVLGYRADEAGDPALRTRVTCDDGRLVCQHLHGDGSLESWLELPASLKQPLMAMVAEVARGRERSDFPVPGGDRLVVSRESRHGGLVRLHLQREPVGFPNQGRRVSVPAESLDLFVVQCRSV